MSARATKGVRRKTRNIGGKGNLDPDRAVVMGSGADMEVYFDGGISPKNSVQSCVVSSVPMA